MDTVLKVAFIATSGVLLALVLKRHGAEYALIISVAAVGALFTFIFGYIQQITDYWRSLSAGYPMVDTVSGPLMKTTVIAVISRVTAEMCRDSEQKALAAGVEFAGTAVSVVIMIPLINAVLGLITSML